MPRKLICTSNIAFGVAGYNSQTPLFTPQAEALIAKHSEGIPRNINNICFNALSLGWVLKQKTISKEAVARCCATWILCPKCRRCYERSQRDGHAWLDGARSRSSRHCPAGIRLAKAAGGFRHAASAAGMVLRAAGRTRRREDRCFAAASANVAGNRTPPRRCHPNCAAADEGFSSRIKSAISRCPDITRTVAEIAATITDSTRRRLATSESSGNK